MKGLELDDCTVDEYPLIDGRDLMSGKETVNDTLQRMKTENHINDFKLHWIKYCGKMGLSEDNPAFAGLKQVGQEMYLKGVTDSEKTQEGIKERMQKRCDKLAEELTIYQKYYPNTPIGK